MAYLIAFHWLWLLAALLAGAVVGWLTFRSHAGRWMDGLVGWIGAAFAIALVVALLKLIPGRAGYWLETALLLFASYVIGCFLGWLAKSATGSQEMGVDPALAGAGAAAGSAAATAVMPRSTTAFDTPAKQRPTLPVGTAPAAPTPAPKAPTPAPIAPTKATATPTAASAAPTKTSDTPASASPAPKLPGEDDHPGQRPQGLLAARDGRPDDLKRVKGIGAQNEGRLHGIGIWHFDQIAAWTAQNVEWVGSYLAFPGRIEREEWVSQAKVLAAGGETEFSKRADAGEVPTSKDDGTHGQTNIEFLKPQGGN